MVPSSRRHNGVNFAPFHRHVRRLAGAAVGAIWLSVAWSEPALPVPVAATAPSGAVAVEHRAAVIVDTGTQVKSVCVRFQEESLTGIEALARAQVDPVFQGFSGKGAAVCALCGVGCPAGDSCLTCNAEGRFWSYSRAPAGTTSLRTSGIGASSTTVRDGDVEGWKFGLGGTPPFATVERVCEEAATSTTTTTPVVVTTAAGGGTTAPAVPTTARTATTCAAAVATTTTPAAPIPSTPAPPVTAPQAGAGDRAVTVPDPAPAVTSSASGLAAARPSSERDGKRSAGPGLALFAAMLVGLVAWAGRARRRRRTSAGPPA
ncbi:MAG: hypothetical protein ACR2MO_06780 [Acidimicrobiales bacterium]